MVSLVVTTWTLFRTAIFFSIPQYCLPPHEFWIDSTGSAWPLFGAFVFVFFLIGVWIVSLAIVAPKTDRIYLAAASAATLLIDYGLISVSNSMEVIYLQETKESSSWIRPHSNPWETSVCEYAKPYLGEWRVLSSEVPFLGQKFPYEAIHLKRNRTVVASYGRYREPVDGYWNAPSRWSNVGHVWTSEVDGAWNFHLEGDRLTLSTPDELDEPVSVVVLERM